jgi:ferredoxin
LAELLDLAQPRQRNLWLNDSDCAACPLGQALPVIQETATQANLVLAAWHHPIELRTQITEPDALTTVHRVAVFSGQQPSYSRREFLTFVRHTTTQMMSTVAAEALAPLQSLAGEPQPRDAELSYQRRHLTASVARLGPPPSAAMLTDSLPWVTVQISDACTACSLCARFCPTAAIRWTTQTQTPATDAAAAQPVTTFDLNFIVNPAQIGRRQMQTLRQGHLGPCRICTIATDLAVRSTCHVCNMSLTKKRKRLKG